MEATNNFVPLEKLFISKTTHLRGVFPSWYINMTQIPNEERLYSNDVFQLGRKYNSWK